MTAHDPADQGTALVRFVTCFRTAPRMRLGAAAWRESGVADNEVLLK
jgi:hypothetical protein